MPTKSLLKRGFKSNAEKLAVAYREKLNIHPCAPLCAYRLAEYMEIPVYPISEFLSSNLHFDLVLGKNGIDCEWSALTMKNSDDRQIIVHNNYHSEGRQQSNIMHELSHIICGHELKELKYDFAIPIGMRQYDPVQEQEAEYLGSTLQLPTPALLWALKRNMDINAIASHFVASVMMVNYRMGISGVKNRSLYGKAKTKLNG